MAKSRSRGVSKQVKFGSGGGRFGLQGVTQSTPYGFRRRVQERQIAAERYSREVAGLSQDAQNALNELAGVRPDTGNFDVVMDDFPDSSGFDDEDNDHTAPVNESLVIHVKDLIEFQRSHSAVRSKRLHFKRKDFRTWRNRLQNLQMKWDRLIEPLTDAYITWKYQNTSPSVSTSHSTCDFYQTTGHDFGIDVLDIHTMARSALITRDENTEASVALVLAGFLGNSPEQPSLAFALPTLDLFFTIRRFKASFSIEAFARVLCHLYKIPYRRFYRSAFSNAFDAYLQICRAVDIRVAEQLGHNTPNHRVLHSCPPCCYELQDEPKLKFTRMWVCDGNNSLRRMATLPRRRTGDTRTFDGSDYFLSTEFVDKYADEVKARPPKRTDLKNDDNEDDEDEEEVLGLGEGGDPTDGLDVDTSLSKSLAACTKNWKAASAEAKKKMWNIFEETGIFASACRHGFILWLADMVRSGELAKYALAMVAMALDTFGEGWILGYDIGCSFEQTIKSSSLGARFQERGCRTCVNAFHGYSHNFLCQLLYHPLNIEGMGLEDLETLERIFSASNHLASITRYATAYRRRVFIDLYFQHWDDEKYQNLANMLHNNYVQALATIAEEGQSLEEGLRAVGLTVADLEAYYADEAQHFQNLGKELDEDLHAVAYVDLLRQYRDVCKSYENACSQFRTQTPEDYEVLQNYSANLSETRKTETLRRFYAEKRDLVLHELVQLELAMNISKRWQPSDPEYIKTLEYMNVRDYRQALEHLHKLVIQRLYELHRLNLSQTGYKMRTQIANALQKRSKAIRRAVKRYNKAAQALQPPRPTLDWTKVSHFTFLDQFNILQDTRHSLFDKPWAKPVVRELMKKNRRVQRAREEIVRCNVELRRLHTSILDEHAHFIQVLQGLEGTPIHGPVREYAVRRYRINKSLLRRINETYDLEGFTGVPSAGKRKGSSLTLNTPSPTNPLISPVSPLPFSENSHTTQAPFSVVSPETCDDKIDKLAGNERFSDSDESDDDAIGGDDAVTDRVEGIVDFLSNLSVHQ
ncbi:hypothetical protein VKT23_015244 [Stygiomarasmius scandens]|uniref:CxC1-like cysteine cluster associated with KDZ transposases domain-containing protein n=1 Tax=Marasmiellus scandens TaxID=2682957 RepID=A0ABR1J1T7_9AGAR